MVLDGGMNEGTKKQHERDGNDEGDSDGDNVGERMVLMTAWMREIGYEVGNLMFFIERDSDGNDVGNSNGLNEEYLDGNDEGGKFLVGYNYCHFKFFWLYT